MKKFYLLFFLLLLLAGTISAQDFKIVGYLPYYRFGLIDQMDFSRLTHLNLAFANPDAQGNLSLGDADIDPVVARAHEHQLTVILSLAGGALTAEWAAAWKELLKPSRRSAFIHRIIQYLQAHDLDGVDNDLEWQYVDDNYSGFVLELRDSLDAYGYLLTAALPGTYRYPQISDAALAAYDWINLMAYDLTGPWAPNNPGPHSPMFFAEASIDYWQTRGVTGDRLTLGVPFYGWQFGESPVKGYTFRTIVGQNAANAYRDQDGLLYYNGIPTIRAKTELALATVGGIMIWEIGQDDFGEYSLLEAIFETVNATVATGPTLPPLTVEAFPNPFGESLQVDFGELADATLELTDMNGRPLIRQALNGGTTFLSTASLPAGVYLLRVQSGRRSFVGRMVKN